MTSVQNMQKSVVVARLQKSEQMTEVRTDDGSQNS